MHRIRYACQYQIFSIIIFSPPTWFIEVLTNHNDIVNVICVVIYTLIISMKFHDRKLNVVVDNISHTYKQIQRTLENLRSGVFRPTYLANHKSAEAHDFLRSKFIAFSGFKIIY